MTDRREFIAGVAGAVAVGLTGLGKDISSNPTEKAHIGSNNEILILNVIDNTPLRISGYHKVEVICHGVQPPMCFDDVGMITVSHRDCPLSELAATEIEAS